MKKLIAILLVSFSSFAGEAPAFLKDATITVTLKNGKTYTYSENEYAVVVRSSMDKPAVVVEKIKEVQVVVHDKDDPAIAGPNTVKAFGGVGPNGFSTSVGASSVNIDESYGALFGVGYSRQVTPRWSLEAVGLSNKTGIMGAGYSF